MRAVNQPPGDQLRVLRDAEHRRHADDIRAVAAPDLHLIKRTRRQLQRHLEHEAAVVGGPHGHSAQTVASNPQNDVDAIDCSSARPLNPVAQERQARVAGTVWLEQGSARVMLPLRGTRLKLFATRCIDPSVGSYTVTLASAVGRTPVS